TGLLELAQHAVDAGEPAGCLLRHHRSARDDAVAREQGLRAGELQARGITTWIRKCEPPSADRRRTLQRDPRRSDPATVDACAWDGPGRAVRTTATHERAQRRKGVVA